MAVNILFIDDDAELQELLGEYFEKKGLTMTGALTGELGLREARRSPPDIVILDLMLPDRDGLEVLRSLNRESDLPVIMLTALEDETDRIVGLEVGADDYLHKPINPRELLARIKAVLRRTAGRKGCGTPRPGAATPSARGTEPSTEPGGEPVWETGEEPASDQTREPAMDLTIHPERGEVRLGEKPVALTQVEFDILHTLAGAKGRIVTRDRLMDLARGKEFEAYDRSIDVHISRIRKKIEPDPARPRRIKTVRGKGYMWEGESP